MQNWSTISGDDRGTDRPIAKNTFVGLNLTQLQYFLLPCGSKHHKKATALILFCYNLKFSPLPDHLGSKIYENRSTFI